MFEVLMNVFLLYLDLSVLKFRGCMNRGVQKIIFEYIHIFCIYFHLCFITQVISAQSVLATIMPPLEKPLLFTPALAQVCQKTENDNSVTNFEIQLRHLKNVRLPFTRSFTRFDNSN